MDQKKKDLAHSVYVAAVLLLCSLPFVCMLFARTDAAIENKRPAEFPSLTTGEGKWNTAFLSGLGAYFEDHFAFRNQIVAADGAVQSAFGVSTAEGVIKGTDGWLYYTASAPDHQRTDVMSDRAAFNAANNLRITNGYVASRGASFIVTVAPNKNSLYPDHMPYYYPAGTGEKNIDKVKKALSAQSVPYADLFAAFASQNETLYLQRDSHWTNKGALLAYNTVLDAAGVPHNDFSDVPVSRRQDTVGDLGRMAYSVLAKPEWNESYEADWSYVWTKGDGDVEAPFITTVNKNAEGSLLMFRDSFGNTLLPFFAQSFGSAAFSKGEPYLLETLMDQTSPTLVVAEKVERNLRDFAKAPPLITAPQVSLNGEPERLSTRTSLSCAVSKTDARYLEFSGTVEGAPEDHTAVYVVLDGVAYEAFTVSTDETDCGFLMYLPPERAAVNATVQVVVAVGEKLCMLNETTLNIQED